MSDKISAFDALKAERDYLAGQLDVLAVADDFMQEYPMSVVRDLRVRAEAAEAETVVLAAHVAREYERAEAAEAEVSRLREQLDEAVKLLALIRTRGWWAKEIDAFLARSEVQPARESETPE